MIPESENKPDFQRFLRQKTSGGCVPVEVLEDFREGNGSEEARASIGIHIKQCTSCMNHLLELQELEFLAQERGWGIPPPHRVKEFKQVVAKKTWNPNLNVDWIKIQYWLTPRWAVSSAIACVVVALFVFDYLEVRSLVEEEQAKRIVLERELKQKSVEARQTAVEIEKKEEKERQLQAQIRELTVARPRHTADEQPAERQREQEVSETTKPRFRGGPELRSEVPAQQQQAPLLRSMGETTLYTVVRATPVLTEARTGALTLRTLSKGTFVRVVGEKGEYLQVEFSQGHYGYVLRHDARRA